MIINHNIAALNTYRQLNNNQNISQKSLEKLSSGLRINRAGDDAAGLAISEKMRAQIRGLDQASRNAQDGISMIQTAEGALNEVHAILQRMRELANQAANDTNVSVDRDEIQKEINQLTSEINRIGNTTEFNTQKLLDGGRQIDANATVSGTTLAHGQTAVTHNMTASHTNGNPATSATKTATNDMAQGTDISGLDATTSLTITIDGVAYFTTGDLINAAKTDGDMADNDEIVAWLANNLKDGEGNAISTVANITNDANKIKIETISTNGTASTIQIDIAGTAAADLRTFTGIAQATDEGESNISTGTDATQAYTNIDFGGIPTDGSKIYLFDGSVIAVYDSGNADYAGLTNDQIKQSLGADYLVDMNGAATVADFMTRFEALTLDNFTVSHVDDDTSRITYNAAGPQAGNMATIGADASAKAAHGYINFTDKPTEGAVITIGDQKIGFYDSTLENYDNDESAKTGLNSDFAIDIKGLTIQQIVDKVVELNASLNDKLTRDVTLSRETKADGSINLKVAAATTGFGGNLISLGVSDDSTAGFNAKFQVGANTAQSMTITINDMRAAALKVSGKDANNNTVTASNGNVAKYVTIANVTDGTTNNAVEFALDVSSHDKATAAISVIQDAIEAVSAERSKLGAYQNRLEHTINNLGTSSENLTAAESRIRDVDMAKEMMEFTKMNILSQAAQAMLAQANQQPQGVLQLLR